VTDVTWLAAIDPPMVREPGVFVRSGARPMLYIPRRWGYLSSVALLSIAAPIPESWGQNEPDPEPTRRDITGSLTSVQPPVTDWAKVVKELNDGLVRLRGANRPDVAVDARLLRQLNVTRSGAECDPALLLRDAHAAWPPAFRKPTYADDRARIEKLLSDGAKRA
jgi:hypothetical protein